LKKLFETEWFKTFVDILIATATIVAIFAAVQANIISQKTLQTQYEPDIVIETKEINFCWGDESAILKHVTLSQEQMDNLNSSKITLNSVNIGAGTAKNIKYSINAETIKKWMKYLREVNPTKDFSFNTDLAGDTVFAVMDGNRYTFSTSYDFKKVFLLPNAGETFSFILPMEYFLFIQKACETHTYSNLPDIEMTIEFFDAQGKRYSKDILLFVESQVSVDINGNGYANCRISMK